MSSGHRVPDHLWREPAHHVAVARFRAEFGEAVKHLFTEVLVLCARLGMGSLATITLDGTKVAANASRLANRSREWLAEQAARAVDEHAATDAVEDVLWGQGSCPDRVPADLLTDDEQDEHPGGHPASTGGDAGKGGAQDSPARRRGVPGGLLGSWRRWRRPRPRTPSGPSASTPRF